MNEDELAERLDKIHASDSPREADIEAALSDWLGDESHIEQLTAVDCPSCGEPIAKNDFLEHYRGCRDEN
jgi:hypothetical protein